MPKKVFTPEQIAAKLREIEDTAILTVATTAAMTNAPDNQEPRSKVQILFRKTSLRPTQPKDILFE